MEQSPSSNKTNTISAIQGKSQFLSFSSLLFYSVGACYNRKALIGGGFLAIFVFFTPNISIEAPGDLCFEKEDVLTACGCFTGAGGMFSCVLKPFDTYLAPYTMAVIWGSLLGVIWFRSQSPLLVTVVGIIVATTTVGLNQIAVGIGMMLASVAIGVVLFQVIRQRTSVLSF